MNSCGRTVEPGRFASSERSDIHVGISAVLLLFHYQFISRTSERLCNDCGPVVTTVLFQGNHDYTQFTRSQFICFQSLLAEKKVYVERFECSESDMKKKEKKKQANKKKPFGNFWLKQ